MIPIILNRRRVSAAVDYDDDAQAFFDRLSVQPDADRKQLYSDLVAGLKTDGIWTLLDVLQIYAAHSQEAGCENIVQDAFHATVQNGAPVFTANRGWSFDGVDDRVTTGFNPTGASPVRKWTQKNAHGGIWSLTDGQQANSPCGFTGNGSEAAFSIANRNTATPDGFRARVNSSSASGIAGQTSGIGLFVAGRNEAVHDGNIRGFHNGSQRFDVTNADTGIPNGEIYVGSLNATVDTHSAIEITLFVAGGALSVAQHGNLHTRLSTFLTGVGL